VKIGALNLVSERVPKIADHVRQDVAVTVIALVEITIKLLAQENLLLSTHCLRALKAIASTMVSKEEVALVAALPSIVGAFKNPDLVLLALDVTNPLSYVEACQHSVSKLIYPDIVQSWVQELYHSLKIS